jgi:hypothetical protein
MKQLDLILCAVAIVVGIVGSWVVYAMRPPAQPAPAVKQIDLTPVGLPTGAGVDTVYDTHLPGGQGGAMGRGGKGKGGFVG